MGSYRALQGVPAQPVFPGEDGQPNLDAMGSLMGWCPVQFNFELEYQKGHDNTVADALSWVTTELDPDTVRSILNRVTLRTVH